MYVIKGFAEQDAWQALIRLFAMKRGEGLLKAQ
jgi:hypothetical protein